jgi:hypothetical protein
MATTAQTHAPAQNATPVAASLLRDSFVALAGLALLSGLYLDGWAHVHLPDLETFFTPWHGVLYSGFLLLATAITLPVLIGRFRGRGWAGAIPAGYELALLGVALFGLGGLLDLGWHTLFGIETDTEALLSPPHLLLATGAGLMLATPLRSAWSRDDAPARWTTWLPPLLSLTLLLALLAFFSSYAHPFAQIAPATSERPAGHLETHLNVEQAIASILLQSAVLSGAVLLLVRRWGWRWPLGSLTLLLPLMLAPLALMFSRLLAVTPLALGIAALLAGLSADALLRLLRPSSGRPRAARSFAALLPATLYAVYLATIALNGGIWWTPHLIFGAVALAAIAGWLVSYLVFPPAVNAR